MSTRSSICYWISEDGDEKFHVFQEFMDNRFYIEIETPHMSTTIVIPEELAKAIAIKGVRKQLEKGDLAWSSKGKTLAFGTGDGGSSPPRATSIESEN